MVQFTAFQKIIAERLALTLLARRLDLTSDHIQFIASHNAFRSRVIWQVIVSSGVRPFLQEHLLQACGAGQKSSFYINGMLVDYHNCGVADPAEWDKTIIHCRQLRNENRDYAFDVTSQVPRVLEAGRDDSKKAKGAVRVYTDPLIDVISFEPHYTGMDTDFTI